MHKDIRLHGYIDDHIEYYAMAAGVDAHRRYFFNIDQESDDRLRFFASGSEFVISSEGITHRGNGGTFCEYMFGVDQPLADLAKGDVINRLVMYGAGYDDKTGLLKFSDRTESFLSYEKIFFDGNAICNYFFFVNSEKISGPLQRQQETILKLLGKTVKRSAAVSQADDNAIIAEILTILDDPASQVFLFKLINKKHEDYSHQFKTLYFRNKKISDDDFAHLSVLAKEYGIDRYQQERMRIDVMYKHPDNKRIVDEYKFILIECNRKGEINKLENARLTRLKTLSVRNKIPGALFYTLDEMLKKDKKMVDLEESDYISESRQILEGLFLSEHQIENTIDREDMIKLLFAKKKATENRDHTFEEILLDATKACDEKIRDGADISLLEGLSHIITYFDRYDSTSSIISQLSFMENVKISEEMLRSLSGNKNAFDALNPRLFEELFIDGILENKYLGGYGRKKVVTLIGGIKRIEDKRLSATDLVERLQAINEEERVFLTVLDHVRERIRNFYSKYSTKADQELLKREVTDELLHKKLLTGEISDRVFHEVILSIKKEAIYIHNLLPDIIATKNVGLREDFLENSGLDRFYVEELEREYYELNELNMEELYQIRKGLN
ncbi:MAG TPA: TIGR04442 family protein [Geobacteraceae bacterium]